MAYVQYAYNTTGHGSTGYAPFHLLFGRHPRLVGDIILDINHDQVYKSEYISAVRKSLQPAYKKCKESILKNNERHKKYLFYFILFHSYTMVYTHIDINIL